MLLTAYLLDHQPQSLVVPQLLAAAVYAQRLQQRVVAMSLGQVSVPIGQVEVAHLLAQFFKRSVYSTLP